MLAKSQMAATSFRVQCAQHQTPLSTTLRQCSERLTRRKVRRPDTERNNLARRWKADILLSDEELEAMNN